MKKILKLIAINLCIVITAIVLYSPGLVCLRISDYSIFRAGMSVIAALALTAIFFFFNLKLLKEPDRKPILPQDVPNLEKAKEILKSHINGRYSAAQQGQPLTSLTVSLHAVSVCLAYWRNDLKRTPLAGTSLTVSPLRRSPLPFRM